MGLVDYLIGTLYVLFTPLNTCSATRFTVTESTLVLFFFLLIYINHYLHFLFVLNRSLFVFYYYSSRQLCQS